jgi:hypothetical protein
MQKLGGSNSRTGLNPNQGWFNEAERLESRIDSLETKISTSEQGIIQRTAETIQQRLPYGQEIA